MLQTATNKPTTKTYPKDLKGLWTTDSDFCYIDKQGLDLIKNNRPAFKEPPRYLDIQLIEKFKIPQEWFLEKRIVNSIHGVRHMMRSAIYAMYLSNYYKLSVVDKESLVIGSILHDVRRLRDEDDTGHGLRSGEWLSNNMQLVNKTFETALDDGCMLNICQAIEYHEIPYAEMNAKQVRVYENNKKLIDLLKTVDALDRYRLTRLNDWPKDKYIKVIPPEWIKHVAYNMVVKSEAKYLQTKNNWASIVSLKEIN